MSAAKPIDWTRPLRVVGTHAAAVVVGINPAAIYPVYVRIDGHRGDFGVTRGGRLEAAAPFADLENVPVEPRVVEMFGVVERTQHGYHMAVIDLYRERASAESYRDSIAGTGRYRIARVLIEEPGQ